MEVTFTIDAATNWKVSPYSLYVNNVDLGTCIGNVCISKKLKTVFMAKCITDDPVTVTVDGYIVPNQYGTSVLFANSFKVVDEANASSPQSSEAAKKSKKLSSGSWVSPDIFNAAWPLTIRRVIAIERLIPVYEKPTAGDTVLAAYIAIDTVDANGELERLYAYKGDCDHLKPGDSIGFRDYQVSRGMRDSHGNKAPVLSGVFIATGEQ